MKISKYARNELHEQSDPFILLMLFVVTVVSAKVVYDLPLTMDLIKDTFMTIVIIYIVFKFAIYLIKNRMILK